MNNSEKEVKTEADSSSSDHPCPLALVTASNVRKPTQKRRGRPLTSPSQKQFMKLKLANDSLIRGRQYLSVPFMRANGMTKPGMITLVGKDGEKWKVNLKEEASGSALCLGTGWKEFAKANGLKTGEYFTLESAWKNEIPMLSLVNTESASDRKERGESSKAMEKESTDTSSVVQNRVVVTLALGTKDVKACTLTIPVAFLKHIEGTNEHHKAKLRSDASKITWEVKIEDGRRLTNGWKEFALAHDLRIGDILIFRQEKDLAFHVTLLGPSGCEIQYESCSEEKNNIGNIPKKKKVKKNPRKETESTSLDPSCFVAYVSPATLRHDKLNLPRSFVRANGLEKRCGDIVLMNEKCKSWTLALKQELCGNTYIRRGWRSFCSSNGLKTGGLYTFKLIKRGRTSVLRLSSTDSELEEESSEGDEVESLSTEPESDEGTPTNLEEEESKMRCRVFFTRSLLLYDRLDLRKSFVRANALETRCGEIVLTNEKGTSWTLNLKQKRSCGNMYITRGWRRFCRANGLKAGCFFTFKLIQRGGTLVLRFSSQFDNNFVTLILKPSNLTSYKLFLPLHFTKRHGINEKTKMTLLDKNGVKWFTNLRSEKTSDRVRLVGGWQEFFEANCVEIGESIVLKLIWEGDKSCVLKFWSKVGSKSSSRSRDSELLKFMRMPNKRFFKPLVPGFHSHLTIPVAFFLKYIEGRNEHKNTARLRSDASKITWEVKIEDGQKLTDGWKEFAIAHDLHIGDILIFRQEKDMAFHVTLLGPSGCEFQYESCSEEENNLGENIPKKKNLEREAEFSSLDPSCFLATIWPSSLRYDTLNLPRSFVRSNGLETRCGGEIVLMNEKGKSWTLALKQKLSGSTYIRRGWRRFCSANVLKTGGVYTFKLIHSGRTPVLRLFFTESESEERNFEKIQRKKAESSSLDPSCFVANISRATLRYDTLGLPMKFSRENGLEARCGEIVLMNEKGRTWKLNLKRKRSCGTMYITQGWRSFRSANGLRAGSSSTFKLIKRGGTLALRLSSKETEEEEEDCSLKAIEVESLSTEPESDEESSQDDEKIKKHRSTWKASSSQSQNRFVTLTLRPFNLEKYSLFLPLRFTRWHGINEETKMRLLDKKGVMWSTDLRAGKINNDKIRLVGGWQEFFKANCVKTGESIMLKLIWEGDKRCVLKFCSKVKHETK
uniref:TF-B3 domain-containing protein n=1 Tax=Brassica campestris TaxID=3711 RepID=A0A3P6CYM0_BRACM|nr:unnamed protein product [Brassica rapa]